MLTILNNLDLKAANIKLVINYNDFKLKISSIISKIWKIRTGMTQTSK